MAAAGLRSARNRQISMKPLQFPQSLEGRLSENVRSDQEQSTPVKIMGLLTDKLKTLLGIQRTWRRRALPRTGSKPPPGARIVSGKLRLVVQAGMTDSLWLWLSSLGWREARLRADRRKYQDIPDIWVALLHDARPEQRERVLMDATAAARKLTPHPQAYRDAHLKRQGHRLR